MNHFDRSWQRLVALARRADSADVEPRAPVGFATRVTARWLGMGHAGWSGSVWEWLAIRGLGVALAVVVLAAVASWPVFDTDGTPEELADLADPLVAELLPPS